MSSDDTLVSDVYHQSDTYLCWFYGAVGVIHKFVMQTFNVYHEDKAFFEGRKGEDWTYFNDYYSMRDNICSEYAVGVVSGNFRRRLLFVYLCGFIIFQTLESRKMSQTYHAMNISKKRKYQDTEFINIEEDEGICLKNFARVLRDTAFVKMIFKNYLFIKNDACCQLICDVIGLYNSYVVDNKLGLNIVNLNKKTIDAQEHHIVKALNQNVYFTVSFDYFTDSSCITCANTVKEKRVLSTDLDGEVDSMHVLICVGYSKDRKALIMKNSWGETWCQTGFSLLKSFQCINTDDMDIYIIDSNLPSYGYLPDSYKLFKKGARTTAKKTLAHKRPTVVQSHADLTSRYVRKTRLLKRIENIPAYKERKELLRRKQTVSRTKKRCPAGYAVNKLDRQLCDLK